MDKVAVKTHLIIKDIHNEYNIKWMGRIIDSKPLLKNGLPIFVIIGDGRVELNTIDMTYIEKIAKSMAKPKGRRAKETGSALIYIKEVDGGEKLVGRVDNTRVKKFAPMYDKVGYR